VDALFEGALVGARDGQDFAETPNYRRLLELVASYGEQELRDEARRELDHADALARPDAWRGEIVRLRGLVAGLQAVRLSAPLAGHDDAYRATVTEADGSEGVVVDFLLPPPDLRTQRDVVDLEAVFFRTVRYENRKGVMVETPYLIGRSLRLLDQAAQPKSTALDRITKVLIGAAAAFLVLRVLLSLRRRAQPPTGRTRLPRAQAPDTHG
jgi:hypothetical protein